MAIPTQAQYEQREAAEAHGKIREVEGASLADRKEAQASFLEAMATDPALVGERIGWLLEGNYGYGPMQMAKRVVAAGGRTNKRAQLTHLVGVFEWQCPPVMAVQAWKKLTKKQQIDLDAVVDMVIAEAGNEEGEESDDDAEDDGQGTWMCSRQWSKGVTYYVASIPHKKGSRAALKHGVDWGYETHPSKALLLSDYWKRRFEADMRHVGAKGVNCWQKV